MEAENWSESVEDLVEGGEVDKAISLLESVISKLESGLHSPSDQLSSALFELAKLYFDKGFSLKADQTRSRALLIRHRSSSTSSHPSELDSSNKELEANPVPAKVASTWNRSLEDGNQGESSELLDNGLPGPGCSDDDWEAIADRSPNELFSPKGLPEVSKLSLEDTKPHAPKRRGRGTFSYKKHGLYSDQDSDGPVFNDSDSEAVRHSAEEADLETHINYGTRHVLVLADFPPSTRTIDLERLLENFKDQGVVIRWVNDTVALAVFRSPSYALEALNCIHCPFIVRVLEENDVLLNSIQTKDLEPPRRRPVTSARTAQRLIAQGMGVKLPSNFGSTELRKQEEARKSRIVTRQNMKDEAWGDDVN